jgi:uncharacterized membrane protein YhaH (DUF805 family)
MSDYLALFRTFDGRIGRKQFWLGVLGLAVAYLVVSILILPLLGFGQFNMASISSSEDAEATSRAFVATAQRSIWATLVLNIVFAYPTLALGLKRRHDRDSSGKDLIAYYVLALLLVLSQAFGIGYVTTDIGNGVMIPTPGTVATALSTIVGLLGLYLLVVLGFLRGTKGPNSYGPDPLGGGA